MHFYIIPVKYEKKAHYIFHASQPHLTAETNKEIEKWKIKDQLAAKIEKRGQILKLHHSLGYYTVRDKKGILKHPNARYSPYKSTLTT